HDAAGDLALHDLAVVVDGREGADVAVLDACARADDHRPADHAVDDLTALVEHDASVDLRLLVHAAIADVVAHAFEDDAVRGQQVVVLAGVDPFAGDDLRADL